MSEPDSHLNFCVNLLHLEPFKQGYPAENHQFMHNYPCKEENITKRSLSERSLRMAVFEKPASLNTC